MIALATEEVWQIGHRTRPDDVCASKTAPFWNQLSNSCLFEQRSENLIIELVRPIVDQVCRRNEVRRDRRTRRHAVRRNRFAERWRGLSFRLIRDAPPNHYRLEFR